MAQVTIDMCDHIIRASDKDERFPLTVNEMRQLAYLARATLEKSKPPLMVTQKEIFERQQYPDAKPQ
ncbi:hypothetical protein IVB43_23960 [Bradyrhizobium sp. 48]|uniref:hypothetical protein n=1 Tax=Bradyrhizobium sp. 48 TaxID=2782676 RepID=UPI001FFB6428|nr:hypothetical protein [Bradyrhizobium sp. 48]MCK1445445.1 hypothetical protein [Bradyrhizobium sp. 48]